jgi:histidyl-tRNA synthetase
VTKPRPLSGFPEWRPGDQAVEQTVTDGLRRVFQLHGFAPLRTRAVEPVDVLLGKGETDKEIYLLRRLQADPDAVDGERSLGLHFDLTVPLARYVLENAGHLSFPYRRYQIQPVWRGERPQEGRYREFVQADIDVIGDGAVAFHHEVEVALVAAEALSSLPIPPIRMRVNNRKVAEGFYAGLGLSDTAAVLRAMDKVDKVGAAGVTDLLTGLGATDAQAESCLRFAAITAAPDEGFAVVASAVADLGVAHPLLTEGLDELARVVDAAQRSVPGVLVPDLSIARGLDYYTGTVYETHLVGHEDLGSVCSGGRYDELARDGDRVFPGVGISVGVTRLVGALLGRSLVATTRAVPSAVLVAVADDDHRGVSEQVATVLRRRGISTEVSPTAARFGKQIRYADRRGIPFVWFPGTDGAADEVKDIRSGDQVPAVPSTWAPPVSDLAPALVGTDRTRPSEELS